MSALTDEIRAAIAPLLDQTLEERLRVIIREEIARGSAAGDPDELLPTETAAAMLGKTPTNLRRAYERGSLKIAPIKIGKRGLRWRRGDIRALAQSR